MGYSFTSTRDFRKAVNDEFTRVKGRDDDLRHAGSVKKDLRVAQLEKETAAFDKWLRYIKDIKNGRKGSAPVKAAENDGEPVPGYDCLNVGPYYAYFHLVGDGATEVNTNYEATLAFHRDRRPENLPQALREAGKK